MAKKIKTRRQNMRNAGTTATITMAMVLTLIGMLALTMFLAHDMTKYIRENINLTIVLNENTSEEQSENIQQFLNKSSFAKSAQFISKELALQEHIDYLGENPEEFLGFNPLFPLFEVKLNAHYANVDSVAVIEKVLSRFSANIEEINYQKDFMNEVNENIVRITWVLMGLTLVLLFISFVLINNTIRLRVYSDRFIVNTMKLVGAKSWFIRKPYVLKSIWNGVVASVLAMLFIVGILYYMYIKFDISARFITVETSLIIAAIILLSGIVLSAVSSYYAVGRYVRMRTDDMYFV